MTSRITADVKRWKGIFAPLMTELKLSGMAADNRIRHLYQVHFDEAEFAVVVQNGEQAGTLDTATPTESDLEDVTGLDMAQECAIYTYKISFDINDNITGIEPHRIHYTPSTTQYTKVDLPTWALCYLINGDTDGLTDEDKATVDKWLEGVDHVVGEVWPTMITDGDEPEEPEKYFMRYPEFGPGADCETFWVEFKREDQR